MYAIICFLLPHSMKTLKEKKIVEGNTVDLLTQNEKKDDQNIKYIAAGGLMINRCGDWQQIVSFSHILNPAMKKNFKTSAEIPIIQLPCSPALGISAPICNIFHAFTVNNTFFI